MIHVRRTLRGRWAASASLVVLIGLAGGIVMGALAAGRRTDSAYPRFLRSARAADLEIGAELIGDPATQFAQRVADLPGVADHGLRSYAFVGLVNTQGQIDASLPGQPLVSSDGRWLTTIDHPKLSAGRAANPDRADEVTVSYVMARQFHVRVGDTLRVGSYTPDESEAVLEGRDVAATGPRLDLQVVGVLVVPGELAPNTTDDAPIHLTPAFYRTYQSMIGMSDAVRIRLRTGAAGVPAFRAAAERLLPAGATEQFVDQSGLTEKIQRAVHLEAESLNLFAATMAVAGLLIIGQTIGRQMRLEAVDEPVLRAIGMTSGQLQASRAVRVGALALGGAVLAVIVAVALSPLSPIGLARVAEPTPGLSADGWIMALGAAALIVIVVAMSLISGMGARPALAPDGGTRSQPRLVARLAATRLSVAAVIGVRFALDPGERPSVPVGSTLAGLVLSVAALATTLTFGASLGHLIDTPRLYGWSWDVAAGNPYARDIRELILPILGGDPGVGRFSGGTFAALTVDGQPVSALALEPLRGSVGPPILEGRSPTRPDEISLGTATLRRLHRRVGDIVTASGGGTRATVRVVGRGVYPATGPSDTGGLGEGAGLTLEGLRRLVPGAPENLFPIVFAPGASPSAVIGRLRPAIRRAQLDVQTATPPTDVENYRKVTSLPLVLAGLIALFAIATLIHTLVTSVRRRRRDLAILKTLGFVRAQVKGAVASQATVLSLIALAAGIPLGVAIGRNLWTAYAGEQGIVAQPIVPIGIIAIVILLAMGMANLVAAVPARLAARTKPHALLRAE